MTVIETERLILRTWRDTDREPFASLNADPRVMEFLDGPLSREESDAVFDHIQTHFEQDGFCFFAAELRRNSQFIGFIGLSRPRMNTHFTPCVEIGWRLLPSNWGHGLATEGAQAALRYGFEILGTPEIVAFTVPANLRSRRVMEKIGMAHNPADDFDHPTMPEGHPLRRHVLYRIRTPAG